MSYSTKEIRERAVKAYTHGNSAINIAEMYDIHRTTVYKWVNQKDINKTLERRSSPGSGRPNKLTQKEITKILSIILDPASKYGFETDFWTIKRIIAIAKEKLKIHISKTTMYEMLYNEDYSYKKPEKRYYEADPEKQEEWINKTIPEIKKCLKKHKGILYFEDESTLSLTAVLGKTWGPVGKTTIQKSTGNKGSVYAMSAISQSGRLIFTLKEKLITSVEVIQFLKQMLVQHKRRHLIVVMDQARPHTSKLTKEFIDSQKRLHVFYLPARSPEFNPDEKVWNHLKNEELKSHKAKDKHALKELAKKKLHSMAKRPRLLRALFRRCEISDFF
ncbi:MAG: IS630 family transposase [Gammaproteobacteria bacterium]|nr:IS630 family transposase [Gammaproteobacteria bacterium]